MTTLIFPLLVSFLVGLAGVLQSGINRRLMGALSLPGAVWLNSLVLLFSATVIFALNLSFNKSKETPGSGLGAIFQNLLSNFKLWYLLPGICGLCIVTGIPWAISRWGALSTFIVMVGSQLLMGLTWDVLVEGVPFSMTRLCGALIAIVGAGIAMIR